MEQVEFKEADIVIGGVPISNAMSMTIRVAIESFAIDLREEGLGYDEMGKGIRDGYLNRINEIRQVISNSIEGNVDHQQTKLP